MMDCTKDKPMPEEAKRDQMGQTWVHHGAEPTGNNVGRYMELKCPNCGQIFTCEGWEK